eukprot:UN07819
MSTEQKEEKRGLKRSLNEMVGDDMSETIVPNAKRRKISCENNKTEKIFKHKMKTKLAAKYGHLNFDPTKMKVDTVAPKQKQQEKLEKKEIEIDQSITLNKPIIANKTRRKRTKKRIQIDENVPQNIKDIIFRKKNDFFSTSEEIKTIRYLENER